MPRALRWLVRGLLGLVGLVLLLVAAALLLLQTGWGRERVRLFALDRLRGMVNGRVEVTRLGGDFLHGVTLDGVSVTGRRGEPFLSVRRLEVDYDVGGFLRREILLGDVTLVEPRITLVQDAAGEWNAMRILPMLRAKPPPPGPPAGWGSVLRIDRLNVVHGAVSVETLFPGRSFGPLGTRLRIADLNGRAGAKIAPFEEQGVVGSRRRFQVDDVAFALPDAGLAVRELDASAELTPVAVGLDRFLVRTRTTELSAAGTVRNLRENPVLDAEVTAAPVSLGELRRLVPRLPEDGALSGTVHLEGPPEGLTATLEEVVLSTSRSRAEVHGTLTSGSGGGARLPAAVDAELVLAALDPVDAQILAPAYPLDEPLHGRLAAKGSPERMQLSGRASFGGATATVDGEVGLRGKEPAYDLALTVRDLDLQHVMGAPRYASDVDARLRAAGTGRTASLEASMTDSRAMGYRIVSADLRGRLDPGALRVESLRVALPRSELRASGVAPFQRPVDIRFSAASRDLGDFRPGGPPMPVRRFELRGLVSGPLRAPDARVEVSADSLAADGAVVAGLQGVATLEDLGTPGFRAGADATLVQVAAGGQTVDSLGLAVDYARGAAEVSLSARVDSVRAAEAHVTADLSGASPRVVLDRLSLTRAEQVWALREPGRLVYQNGVATFDQFIVASGEQRLELEGMASVGGRQDLRFTLANLSLEDLQRLAGREPAAVGVLNVSGALSGSAKEPVLDTELGLERGRAAGMGIRRLHGRVQYAKRRLGLDVELEPEPLPADTSRPDTSSVPVQGVANPGSVSMRGSIPVDLAFTTVARRFPDQPIDLTIESRNLSPSLFQRLTPAGGGQAPEVKALQFELHLTGRPSEPVLDSRFSLGEARVAGVAIHSLAGTLAYGERRLSIDATLIPEVAGTDTLAAPGALMLAGTFPVDLTLGPVERRIPDRPIDVRLASRNLTLATLEAFTPRIVDARGPVEIDVRLAGTPSEPRYDGRVEVRGGSLRNGHKGPLYTAIDGQVLFDNDRISIPELRASSPGGEARVTGEVALRELTLGDVQARLTAEDFTLLDQDGQSLIVDADVKVSGSTKAPVVAGAVDVDQFTWPIPQKPDKDVIDLDDAIFYVAAAGDTLAQRGPPPPGPWQQATVDVDVTIHHDAVLRNDKTLVAVQGDLSVDKRPGEAQPSIAGELTVTRGFYADFGKRFDVQRGDVRFFGTPEMNPGLDVEAVTQVTNSETGQDVTVTLTLGGTAKEPTLDFASTPAYDKSEIVSLLLFGTTTPGQGQQGRFEDTVGRLAAGQASAPLARALSSELGLDLLEIQPGIGTAGGAGFRAGKYISPDVFVTYQQGTGPLQETQLGIQYRLTRKLSLETQIGTRQGQQQVGGDVFYQFEY